MSYASRRARRARIHEKEVKAWKALALASGLNVPWTEYRRLTLEALETSRKLSGAQEKRFRPASRTKKRRDQNMREVLNRGLIYPNWTVLKETGRTSSRSYLPPSTEDPLPKASGIPDVGGLPGEGL